MTDSPVTPRTEAGRTPLRDPLENDPLQTLAGKALWGDLSVHGYDLQAYSQIRAIEREAGSTDALRMDDDHEPHPCCRHPRCCPHALAASDAGPATRSYIGRVRDTEERLIAESLRTDAGPAGIDVERLEHALNDMTEGDSPDLWWDVDMGVWYATPRIHDLAEKIAAEYTRLSRESDR
jgi:hypothetical protein